MIDHASYMLRAFELATLGRGLVSPNPLVGALVVKNDEVIGEGYHQKYGGPHAEVNAIANAKQDVADATIYCNLEPCCHTNKQTPPCTNLLIEKKIKRVIISNLDPNPEVSGKGVDQLRQAGIEVITSVLEKEGARLNEIFFKYMTTGKPFVHLKFAQTLDGKIATSTGDAKWISNELARDLVHQWRYCYDSILVGRKTLSNDNPSLTARSNNLEDERSPFRIIVGNPQNMDPTAKVFSDRFREKTLVCSDHECSFSPFIKVNASNGRIDLEQMLEKLGEKKITSLLIEGGTEIISQILNKKLYDRITIFIAPKIVGGDKAYSKEINIEKMAGAIEFDQTSIEKIGDQIMVEGYVHRNS